MTETQTIRLIEFHNRYVDLQMKGSWGYIDPELKAQGFAMITAESMIEEFHVETTQVLDDNRQELPSPLLIGTDKYGRKLEVPIDKIIAVGWLDTAEQARLKALVYLKEAYGNIPADALANNEALAKMIKDNQQMYDELMEKGVRLYQRA